jgi:hypothetical protein
VGTDELTFAVILDTHVVNLDAYDLLELAVVRTVDEREIAPLQWDAPPGGHHREGTLRFPLISQDGVAVLESGSGGVALVIRDMAGVPERVLEWSW